MNKLIMWNPPRKATGTMPAGKTVPGSISQRIGNGQYVIRKTVPKKS